MAVDLETIAEGDAHAQWVVDNHIGAGPEGGRQRCAICDAWWPCSLVELAALAVLLKRRNDHLSQNVIELCNLLHGTDD